VKLAEFNALCEREWNEARGDVTGLRLTDESYAELAREVLERAESLPLDVMLGAKAAADEAVNPVTRSVVKVTGGASIDSAEVYRHYGSPHASHGH